MGLSLGAGKIGPSCAADGTGPSLAVELVGRERKEGGVSRPAPLSLTTHTARGCFCSMELVCSLKSGLFTWLWAGAFCKPLIFFFWAWLGRLEPTPAHQ